MLRISKETNVYGMISRIFYEQAFVAICLQDNILINSLLYDQES